MALDFPTLYLLQIGFENQTEKLQNLEREIGRHLTYYIQEAKIIIGKVSTKKRAGIELRRKGLYTREVVREERVENVKKHGQEGKKSSPPPKKRRKVDVKDGDGREIISLDTSSESEVEKETDGGIVLKRKLHPDDRNNSPALGPSSPEPRDQRSSPSLVPNQSELYSGDTIKVVNLAWYTDSVKLGRVLPLGKYLVYEGRRIPKPKDASPKPSVTKIPGSILSRARADSPPPSQFTDRHRARHSGSHSSQQITRPTALLHQSTSELETASGLPPLPSYLNTNYSCQRPTPRETSNDAFIAQLKKIMFARQLGGDEIGRRAYNAAIASIAAYPYTLTSTEEILRLPKCGNKFIGLFQEWKDTGRIQEVDLFESDPRMTAMKIFFDILYVHEATAKSFYNNGWRDLDDVIEHGWKTLTRNQQIGVKYYYEFQQKVPREEVEKVGSVVLSYANRICDGFQMVICGGYRRGKRMCGDVDVILSHPDEEVTDGFITCIVRDLEKDGWIPYTLSLSTKNSNRNQDAVSWKGSITKAGSGFCTLDKALVVWQDTEWPSKEEDLVKNPNAKNPNVHRRVDIIISPWKTAGCAVVGWSGGTMFERDIRTYCKRELGLKFDSSGVRRQDDGAWVDLEKGDGDLLVKEKRVFEGLALEWRDPTLRCTDGG